MRFENFKRRFPSLLRNWRLKTMRLEIKRGNHDNNQLSFLYHKNSLLYVNNYECVGGFKKSWLCWNDNAVHGLTWLAQPLQRKDFPCKCTPLWACVSLHPRLCIMLRLLLLGGMQGTSRTHGRSGSWLRTPGFNDHQKKKVTPYQKHKTNTEAQMAAMQGHSQKTNKQKKM